ncbi:unnamed protein product [Pleuronectes platessa]|uniref:Uncharacterized protein n=1 Tax=Pleuronectes platessa TaxID=8262 RepID=A0A9N7YPX1_PLEPL|nr:unnamed protein product [Pleuronectes platessa]
MSRRRRTRSPYMGATPSDISGAPQPWEVEHQSEFRLTEGLALCALSCMGCNTNPQGDLASCKETPSTLACFCPFVNPRQPDFIPRISAFRNPDTPPTPQLQFLARSKPRETGRSVNRRRD